jgi:zinc protease
VIVPEPRRVRLDNGLTAVVALHGGADAAAVQLWVRVGARDETDAESGLAHFVEHLLFKGTPTRGPGVIDRTVSSLGGEINAATGQDFTYYHVVLPARHLDTALEVVADAAMRAVFAPEELERERLVVLEEIRRAEDSPTASLWRVLQRQHFTGHRYGRPVLGSADSVRSLGRDAVVDYHRRHYVPGNTAVVVVGRVDVDPALARIREAFAAWAPAPVPARAPVPAPAVTRVARAEELRPLGQAYLGVAWRGPVVPHADVYAVDLLTSILGRGRASRLTQALKERRSLVSTIGASYTAQYDAGTIAITARAAGEKRADVEGAILAEVERLRAEPPTEAELARALTTVEAGRAFGYEAAEGLAYAWGLAETLWSLEFELGYLDAARRVTRDDLGAVADRYLALDRFTGAVLAPAPPGLDAAAVGRVSWAPR